ncbi:hypothetical protein [Alkanindiges illinoisensis]|uniref:Bacteriophage protein n=1 Tax=Alkanindiges illinoisensis TaxID=197183 RepID=A0A4Y7XFS3_9GAMM|nr:hypothetical protein [Alkanindiges illinoisensis]TEU30079.1 hypothetical protein E2B99_03290 [Alkanindiges illinoisensis]
MSGSTIRDFMVALGFNIDNAGAKRMGDTLQGVENKAKSLNTVLLGLATGAVIAVTKTASELDKLYYSSQRIGASASNIRGFEAAISQMGGTAGNALQTLESLSQKIRQSPGYEGMVNNLGVSTRDQNGAMRDRVEVMKDMSKTLAGMDYYQANAYASAMGIDENTLMAMRDPAFLQNMEKYQKLQKDMGMSDDMAKSGKDFMVQFRDITMTVKALSEVILMTAGKALIPVLKIINTGLQSAIQWFSGLDPRLKAFLAAGLKIAMLVLIFGGLFAAISKLAGALSILKGLLFLFRALNLAILASPIGLILALAAAIALLWDDYQTWKNGGKSLIDWGEWAGGIETAITRIKELAEVIMGLRDKAIELTTVGIEKTVNAAKTAATITQDVAKAGVAAVTDGAKALNSAMGGNFQFNPDLKRKGFNADKAKSIQAVASRLGINPNDLAAVISFETAGSFDPGAKNPNSSATGLIQFMKGSGGTKGKYYGMSRKKFASLSFDEQMQYVEKYFKERGFKPSKSSSVADVYTAVTGYGYKKGTAAYDLNKVWDSNKDGYIAKGEMVQNNDFKAHQKNYFVPGQVNISNSSLPALNNAAPPSGNPHKDQINQAGSKNSNSQVVSMQQKTDIHVYGADNAQQTALAVQRQQDAVNIQMARNARGIIE